MEKTYWKLLICCSMLLFTACTTTKEESANIPSQFGSVSGAIESSVPESSVPHTDNSQSEIILENTTMDFIDTLGFKVEKWIGVAPVETKVINGTIAEMKLEQDMTSIAYLRISSSDDTNIAPTLEGNFESLYSENIDGISVQLGYTVQGPMIASWEKDDYFFCFYQKKGEASSAQESFTEGISYYVKDIVVATK